jgi:hypothetical protein
MTDVYSPYSKPVGSFDQSLIPTSITSYLSTGSVYGVARYEAVPPPGELTVDWIATRLRQMTAPDYHVNRLFFEGDHWQDAAQWSGPAPNPSERDAGLALAAIRRSFVSRNCIRETTTREANGVLSREPSWYLTNKAPRGSDEPLTAEEEVLRQQGEALLTDWWDRTNAGEIMSNAAVMALLGKRAALRLYVPPGLLTEDGRLPIARGDFESALNSIELEAVAPDEGGVIIDRASKREYGAFLFKTVEGIQHAEVVFTERQPQLSTDKPPETIIRIIEGQGNTATASSYRSSGENTTVLMATDGTALLVDTKFREARMQIGGRLTVFDLCTEQLITEQVRELQRAINKALTMGDHNIEVAGFVERTIFNGQMPGHYEPDPNRSGRQRFVRDDYTTGGGAINFINGIPVYDENGQVKGVANPTMHVRQPTLPDAFEKTERWYYAALLDECHQAHYLLAGSEYVSGESRIQSRAEYVEALRKLKKIVDASGRWLLETLLALGGWLAQQPLYFEPMRATFACRLVPGPATAEGTRSAIELRAAGGLSREGMMERTDIEDIDAEIRRINNEEEAGVVTPDKSSGRPGDGVAAIDDEEPPAREQERKNGRRKAAVDTGE